MIKGQVLPETERLCTPKIHVLKPNPQHNSIRRGAFERLLSQDGRILTNGIIAFIKVILDLL